MYKGTGGRDGWRSAVATAAIVTICVWVYCAGSGWALPGLFGAGYIVSRLGRGDDEDGGTGA